MTANTPFITAEWLSTGKKWANILTHIKLAGKQEFVVPSHIHAEILPSSGISIQELLGFTLPNQTITVNVMISPMAFFSRNTADSISEASLTRLRRLPIPPTQVVKKLVELKHQAWLDGCKSVKYIHLHDSVTTHFPMWLVSFWDSVIDMQNGIIKPWVAAKEWLAAEIRQKRSIERRQVAEDVRAFLAALPWDSEPVRTMWRFLGRHFTTGSQQDSLLDRLSDCIAAQPDIVGRLCVRSLALSTKILEAATGKKTGTYATA
jgi:hypothetical protein